MGLADIGDQPAVWLAHLDEMLYVIGVVGSHLYDGQIGGIGYFEKRQRNADVVVEIAFRSRHVILCRQYCMDQVLGSGLAVGTSQSENSQMLVSQAVASMIARQRPQGVKAVGDGYDPRVAGRGRGAAVVYDGAGRARFERLQRILVPVEILAFQSNEHLTAGDGAAVCRHATAALPVFQI